MQETTTRGGSSDSSWTLFFWLANFKKPVPTEGKGPVGLLFVTVLSGLAAQVLIHAQAHFIPLVVALPQRGLGSW